MTVLRQKFAKIVYRHDSHRIFAFTSQTKRVNVTSRLRLLENHQFAKSQDHCEGHARLVAFFKGVFKAYKRKNCLVIKARKNHFCMKNHMEEGPPSLKS